MPAIGRSDHQPIHTRLHTASIKRGSEMTRVQTLQGLACRAHVSSSMRKRPARRRSNVIGPPSAENQGSGELHDDSVDRKAVTWLGIDGLHNAVPLRPQGILHLHGFDNRERIASLHLLASLNMDGLHETWHW